MGKRMIIGLLCALMLGCALPGTGFAQAFPSGESSETIGPKIEAFFADREDKAVGMATSVFGPEGSYYRGFHGFADKENELAVSEETVFEWGSISKLLVWVSLMQLEERGLLDLKDDIRTYLPEGFFPALAYDTPITSLDLMHHTAGFEETIFGLQAKTVPEDFSLVSLRSSLAAMWNGTPPVGR